MKNRPEFVPNPQSPDIYADTASSFMVSQGNMRITLDTYKLAHAKISDPVARVTVGRLIMPATQAEAMAKAILDMIKEKKTEIRVEKAKIQ